MDLDAIRNVFFQECEDQLIELDTGLVAMRDGDGDRETLGDVFRAVHSIKGGGGAFGLEELVRFAHVFETALDEIRSGRLDPSSDSLIVLFRASDMLADLVRAARDGMPTPVGELAEVTAGLNRIIAGQDPAAGSAPGPAKPAAAVVEHATGPVRELAREPVPMSFPDLAFGAPADAPDLPERRQMVVRFRPKTDFYARGHEPGLLIRELARLGSAKAVCFMEDLPALDLLDPEQPYLTWQVALETDADEEKIREVFEFVEWDCDLELYAEGAENSAQPGQEAPQASARPVLEFTEPSAPDPRPLFPCPI